MQETGNCWKLLRAMGRGGFYLEAPRKERDRFVFGKKKKARLAASLLTEVFANRKEPDTDLQVRADRVKVKLVGDQIIIRVKDFAVVSTDRVSRSLKSKARRVRQRKTVSRIRC